MIEHLVAKDSISNLRVRQQIHFQQASLQMALGFVVSFERLQKESRALLDVSSFNKAVNNLEFINQMFSVYDCTNLPD